MSLEQALENLAAAVALNTIALANLSATVAASAGGTAATQKLAETAALPAGVSAVAPGTQKSKGGRPKVNAPTQAAAVGAQPAAQAQAAKAAANGADQMEYAQLRESVLAVAKEKGHNVAVGILAKFGVKIAQELKPEQYQAVFDTMQAALIA